jgi:Zn-dependent M32 family carboxypeptidase
VRRCKYKIIKEMIYMSMKTEDLIDFLTKIIDQKDSIIEQKDVIIEELRRQIPNYIYIPSELEDFRPTYNENIVTCNKL